MWQLMSKSMNILNDHAHIKIETWIDNDQRENGYIPGQRATMRYPQRGLVHHIEHKTYPCITKQGLELFEEKLDF